MEKMISQINEPEARPDNEQKEEPVRLEEAFAELDKIVAALEREDGSLEDSFEAYRRGMELVKKCEAQIDLVEKQVMQLSEDGEISEF